MSDFNDTASAFGAADADVHEGHDVRPPVPPAPPAKALLTGPSSPVTPSPPATSISLTSAEPPMPAVAASSPAAVPANTGGGSSEDRSPLPRVPFPASDTSASDSTSQPTLWEEQDIELEETPPSSPTWCSPAQVLPNTISPHPSEATFAAPAPPLSPPAAKCTAAALPAASIRETNVGEREATVPFLQTATPLSVPSARGVQTTFSVSLDAVASAERRSITVTHHPLDDDDSNNSGSASPGGAGAMTQKRLTRMFSPDFDSPGRTAEEMHEWREGQRASSSAAGLPSSSPPTTAAAAAHGATTPQAVGSTPAPLPDSENTGLSQRDVRHAQPSPSADARPTNDYGVVSVIAAEKTPVLPTPYPVTSTTSQADWSSAPRLGFAAPISPNAATAEATSLTRRDAEEHKREDKWYRLCRGVSLLASATPEAIVRLRAAAREYGIPHHLRGVMWLTLTGMALKVDENEYFCAKLLRRNGYVTGPNADAIAADVQRTFPGHPYFSEKDVGIYKLTTVLHALCWRNPLLSYCQSFNFLAAFLLLILDDEERVFWLLVHIFEQLLPNDFYGETLLGANVEQAVLERLVQQRLPRVAARFTAAGLQVHTLVANWMMSMFVNIFPPSTALRMWDYLFCRTTNPGERTPAHLEITLAVLKYLEEKNLLSGDDAGELLMALREQTASLFDAAAVIRIANTLAISPEELHQLRREAKPAVVQRLKSREQARAIEQERRLAQELQAARISTPPAPKK